MADEMTLDGLAREIREQIAGLRQDMDARFHEARDHTNLQFEETRRVINLGLETQDALRESMDRRFDEAAGESQKRHDLLASVARNLGVRTGQLEADTRKPRRRG